MSDVARTVHVSINWRQTEEHLILKSGEKCTFAHVGGSKM